ncbi:xylosyltransferase 1-like [Actinia tenebrosa]|uniref:protein xylosyltransferase n=1 Tax=Actinia tenebrosa TaxID=6105 RepID=A0A6P8J9P1_ACTTE|nr:xylosyltransferase 1-like [Actinia tenebrosa]
MALQFNLVKFILVVAVVFVIVQILITLHFSSKDWPDDHPIQGRNHIDDFHKRIKSHVGLGDKPHREEAAFKSKTARDISHNKNTPNRHEPPVLEMPYKPPCKPKHKDANSALRRVKSETCRREIYKISCLSESNKLYMRGIKRYCPLPQSSKSPAKSINDAKPVPYGPPIRIAYILTLHGRAFRQVKRLFKAIYHRQHYYYFHIDTRSDYLRREVANLIKDFPNTALAPWSMSTIWGGATLLQMLLRCMEDLIKKKNWKWDFFINISGSDYPIKDNTAITRFLRSHRDQNFLKPHGRDLNRFIKKQGLDRTFLQCDDHMWRLGNRSLPPGIDIDGGSDWIALNRKYCHYLVTSTDSLVTGLKHMYKYTLLPAESFFHTVLRNGPLCENWISTNLRLTNWKRKLGCRCQYKHIVDWCGCSPNNFKPEDMTRIKSQSHNYFARKFEAIVNQEVINELDAWLYGEFPPNTKGLHYYWENMYHHDDNITKTSDAFLTFFYSFGRIATKQLSRDHEDNCELLRKGPIKEVAYFNQHDQFSGLLVLFDVEYVTKKGERKSLTVESWVSPNSFEELMNLNMTKGPERLVSLDVGTGWDQKERVFRNLARLISPYDDPILVHRWVHGEEFDVKIMWVDPINVVSGVYEMHVVNNWVVSFHKPAFKKPMRPGKWTLKMIYTQKGEDMVIGETTFLVIPLGFYQGTRAPVERAMETNHGPPGGIYNTNDFLIEFDREANNTEAAAKEATINARKSGDELDRWIDKVVGEFWTVEGTCLVEGEVPDCLRITPCSEIEWSSRSPDPKSAIGKVKADGRIR